MASGGGGEDGSATVLLVEDDGELRDIIGDVLEERGFEVIPASHGKQAIEYLQAAPALPCAVLLDLMMPIVNGWDCLRAIRADKHLTALPVIVMTAVDRDHP